MEKTAIVLSGGGSCGAYQVGVWKALRKLKVDYHIVTGTSVGALNGLLMVQGDFHKAHKIWSNLDYDTLFEKFADKNDKNLTDLDVYMKYADNFINNGGMDVVNLERIIVDSFKADDFYNSPIDYGIIVYNLSKLKLEEKRKSDLTKENIKDYIIASSACFPAIKIKKIGKQKYIDGGYGDNLPINLAIDMGAQKIIAVDLQQIGITKEVNDTNIPITYIRPRNNIGSFLIFDKSQARKNIKYGYYDTLKEYGVLKGDKYTFYKFKYDKTIKLIFDKYSYLVEKKISSILKKSDKKEKFIYEKMLESLESVGEFFELDNTKIYTINQFNRKIKHQIRNTPELDIDVIKKKLKNNELSSLLGKKYIVKYIYQKMQKQEEFGEKLLSKLFQKEYLIAIYLQCI